MIIKYKGVTSCMLSDLSRSLGMAVDLKVSESILKSFFQQLMEEINADNKIRLISTLPAFLKPFCLQHNSKPEIKHSVFQSAHRQKTNYIILKVLEKYVMKEQLLMVCSCIPENVIPEISLLKKEIFLAA